MTCEACGAEIVIGDFPFCGGKNRHGRSTLSTHPDDIPGGRMFENGFASPRRFDSHSAHRRALAAEGLEIRAKWAGPHDRHLTRWDTVDLDGAAALVSRGTQARAAKRVPDAVITVTDGPPLTAADLT